MGERSDRSGRACRAALTGDRRPALRPSADIPLIHKEIALSGVLVIVLLLVWLIGLVTANTMGGFIHVVLILAVVVFLFRGIQGRNPLRG